MNQELHREVLFHDIDLPDACPSCGGRLAARFAPGTARGICLACHVICSMAVERKGDSVVVVPLPAGEA
jgi:hypothetical protein